MHRAVEEKVLVCDTGANAAESTREFDRKMMDVWNFIVILFWSVPVRRADTIFLVFELTRNLCQDFRGGWCWK